MRVWKLKPSDPLNLILASDACLVPTDYLNDQIWEITLDGGEPVGISLQTTFGLRAKSFQMLPRFTEQDVTICNPLYFNNPPLLNEFYSNYLSFYLSPFNDLDVQAEYWVPYSQGILIRYELINQSSSPREIKFEWIAQLSPHNGQLIAPLEIENTWILSGKTFDLFPVILISGGAVPKASPYPSFNQVIHLMPGEARFVTMSFAAYKNVHDSFTAARHYLGRAWESEINRIRMHNTGMIDVFTGNPDWDATFAFSQTSLHRSRINPKGQLPYPSFVLSRQKDQGYSFRGDGLDYNYLWNGQSPLESYFLVSSSLPAAADFAKGLVRNFISVQSQDGSIDWKPGVAGQRSQLLATPILCTLTWRIFQCTADQDFLKETFVPLYRYLKSWFTPQHDRDQDGIPEWDHIFQAGFENHPIFSYSLPNSQGVDISTAESPALASMLFRECQSLLDMGNIIQQHDFDLELESIAQVLHEFVDSTWNNQENTYLYRDRDTHESTVGEKLIEQSGASKILIRREFKPPVRVLIHIQVHDENTRRGHFLIHGIDQYGKYNVERLDINHMHWNQGIGYITGSAVYSQIESIDIEGLKTEDTVTVYTANYHFQDLTSFLPLWAGIPHKEQAYSMIKHGLTNPQKYSCPFGLRLFPNADTLADNDTYPYIDLIWTQLIGEGMLRYGYRKETAQLFSQFMPAIVQSLQISHAFREQYHAVSGMGNGETHIINGVAPLGLFLDTLGVRLLSSNKIALKGFNPYSLPVTVKYRGINIYKQMDKTTVIFPNGETTIIEGDGLKIITLE